jgi:hypothetical protein
MEWLDGQDLEQRLSSWESDNQRGPEAQLLSLLKSITETLERAHGIGITRVRLGENGDVIVRRSCFEGRLDHPFGFQTEKRRFEPRAATPRIAPPQIHRHPGGMNGAVRSIGRLIREGPR